MAILRKLFKITLFLFKVFTVLTVPVILWFLYIERPYYVGVTGTGSMYPTFPKGNGATLEDKKKETVAKVRMTAYPRGIKIAGKDYLSYNLSSGDLVSFIRDGEGYIKRVIGVPGDTIELQNGLVYRNNVPLEEPYTALPHSTFGGTGLAECKIIVVPPASYFVLGDNRKESDDSRFLLGMVSATEIDGYLSHNSQLGLYDKHWRNTEGDLSDSTKIKLDEGRFMDLLNEHRTKAGVSALVQNLKLSQSADARAAHIIKTGDFSMGGDSSGYSMEKAISEAGYWNPKYGEIPVQGYYTAEELVDNMFLFDDTKNFLLNKDFDDIGIGVVEGNMNNCPTQMIVVEFGGYVPPAYSDAVVKSWESALQNLRDIKPSWEKARDSGDYYTNNKNEIDRIIEIINLRISRLESIVSSMKNLNWLTSVQEKYLEEDIALSEEQNSIAIKLNKAGDN